ncbi:hypothetical protein [Saccharibacillus sp. JS10]|uniref:hypothetical protein n=1 Tax=Saccharibacillus sp. JS10 TaxID=2950552 RepID=UPI00210A8653|nr:hypothetical protein [Saccharibacillus sp. JS10]MCQ4087609.1 hypothetical protein [Saccharibacillus sp. JS10]
MKKWWSLSLSLALLSSAVVPTSVFAAQTSAAASSLTATQEEAALTPSMAQAVKYADALDKIVKYEDLAADTFNSVGYVSASNRKSVYTKLNSVIVPNYSKFYYHLKQIKPGNAEIQKLHNYYLQGAALQLEGMQLLKKSLYGSKINWTTYKQGQAKLKSGKAKIDVFMKGFESYMDKLG